MNETNRILTTGKVAIKRSNLFLKSTESMLTIDLKKTINIH